MHRRKFLSLISGAVAAVAGGLGLVKAATPEPDVMTEMAAMLRAKLLGPEAAMPFDRPVKFDWLRFQQPGFNLNAKDIRGYEPGIEFRQYLAFDRNGLFWTKKNQLTGKFEADNA